MYRLIVLVLTQTVLFSGGQVMLKLAMKKVPSFSFTWGCLKAVLTDWWLLAAGASFCIGSILWLYILKNFPFSQAYPLTALGYVFGMLAAITVFGEAVAFSRWLGVLLIVAGCFFIMR